MADTVQNTSKIGFGGGCHWCTESVFQSLRGVLKVDQGYIRSDAPADTWAEAVVVEYVPSIVTLEVLCEIHLRTHSSDRDYPIHSKYRSAIYTFSEEQTMIAQGAIIALNEAQAEEVRTRVLPFAEFKPSPIQFQDYHRNNRDRPFSLRVIDPKLDNLRANFPDRLIS